MWSSIGEQCRCASCKKRGTQNNHRHNECHLRMVSKQLHASIPAWAKHQVRLRITHPKQSDKQSPSQTSLPATTTDSRKCYICNDPNHLANACSLGIEHKQMLRKILLFMTLSESSFPIQHHKACASRMINALNENQICSSCIQP
jgi:hypothetical protein